MENRIHLTAADAEQPDPCGPFHPALAGEDASRHGRTDCIRAGARFDQRRFAPPVLEDTTHGTAPPVRRDGWTPDRQRTFLLTLADSGVVRTAAQAAGMSVAAAYAFRNRASGHHFALAWDAAVLRGRNRLVDTMMERALNGWVETLYRDGEVVAERHRFDNRMARALLARLDARADVLGPDRPARVVAAEFDAYLDVVCGDAADPVAAACAFVTARTEDPEGCADEDPQLLLLQRLSGPSDDTGAASEGDDADPCGERPRVWTDEDGMLCTDYPPPAGFAGIEEGDFGEDGYSRSLTIAESAAHRAAGDEAGDNDGDGDGDGDDDDYGDGDGCGDDPEARLAEDEWERDAVFGFAGGRFVADPLLYAPPPGPALACGPDACGPGTGDAALDVLEADAAAMRTLLRETAPTPPAGSKTAPAPLASGR
jgi:hypothetical protein